MNPGGEPERDDTGLPPVDIEIPDDARDLDLDVQAYHRELRALRRGERRGRWHRSLSKDGVVLPLLACCLILALITGTLLTVFTATSNSGLTGLPGSANSTPTGSSSPAAVMVTGQSLPDAMITPDNAAGASIDVDTLGEGVMLVLVPSDCRCTAAFRWVAEVASKADVTAYVIYTPATAAEVQQLDKRLGRQLSVRLLLARELDNQLSEVRDRVGIPAGQLTAILVGPHQAATWVKDISPRDNQAPLVGVLTGKRA